MARKRPRSKSSTRTTTTSANRGDNTNQNNLAAAPAAAPQQQPNTSTQPSGRSNRVVSVTASGNLDEDRINTVRFGDNEIRVYTPEHRRGHHVFSTNTSSGGWSHTRREDIVRSNPSDRPSYGHYVPQSIERREPEGEPCTFFATAAPREPEVPTDHPRRRATSTRITSTWSTPPTMRTTNDEADQKPAARPHTVQSRTHTLDPAWDDLPYAIKQDERAWIGTPMERNMSALPVPWGSTNTPTTIEENTTTPEVAANNTITLAAVAQTTETPAEVVNITITLAAVAQTTETPAEVVNNTTTLAAVEQTTDTPAEVANNTTTLAAVEQTTQTW
jgi:hypothetical protein